MIKDKEFNSVSQIAHTLGGAFAMVCGSYLFGPWSLFDIAPLFVLYAGIKEFWYDVRYESKAVRGSSLEDFLFYLFGMVIGIAIVLGKIHFGG
jgi:hypothetical protein